VTDITKKNKEYIPLRERYYELGNLCWKLREEKDEVENTSKRLQWLKNDILKTDADLADLQKEADECLDETNYLVYGETLSQRKLNLERFKDRYANQLWDFESEDFYAQKIAKIEKDHAQLDKERDELNSRLDEIRNSLDTNDLTGPYTISPIEITLDFETGEGKTMRQLIESPPSKVMPFRTITIFSALDG
jgi:chromosome segregation ATPase